MSVKNVHLFQHVHWGDGKANNSFWSLTLKVPRGVYCQQTKQAFILSDPHKKTLHLYLGLTNALNVKVNICQAHLKLFVSMFNLCLILATHTFYL